MQKSTLLLKKGTFENLGGGARAPCAPLPTPLVKNIVGALIELLFC